MNFGNQHFSTIKYLFWNVDFKQFMKIQKIRKETLTIAPSSLRDSEKPA